MQQRRIGIGVGNAAIPEGKPVQIREVIADITRQADEGGFDGPHLAGVVDEEQARGQQHGVDGEQQRGAGERAMPLAYARGSSAATFRPRSARFHRTAPPCRRAIPRASRWLCAPMDWVNSARLAFQVYSRKAVRASRCRTSGGAGRTGAGRAGRTDRGVRKTWLRPLSLQQTCGNCAAASMSRGQSAAAGAPRWSMASGRPGKRAAIRVRAAAGGAGRAEDAAAASSRSDRRLTWTAQIRGSGAEHASAGTMKPRTKSGASTGGPATRIEPSKRLRARMVSR